MARLSGPLFGDQASGPLFGVLFFKIGTTTPQVSRQRSQNFIKNINCRPERVLFYNAKQAWLALEPSIKSQWRAIAARPLTGYNLFLQDYLNSHQPIPLITISLNGLDLLSGDFLV